MPASDPAFRARILAERTLSLAARGRAAPTPGLLLPHLVCETGGQLHALPPARIAGVLPFGCWPVPLVRGRAAHCLLGVFSSAGRLYSLIDLQRLLDAAPGAPEPGGLMLLLRRPGASIALRVDAVHGLMALARTTGDSDDLVHATLADTETPLGARLVTLVDPEPKLLALTASETTGA